MPFLTPTVYLAVAAVAAFYAGLSLLTPFGEERAIWFESHLPLRGRWLRIGLGILLLMVSLFLFIRMAYPKLLGAG